MQYSEKLFRENKWRLDIKKNDIFKIEKGRLMIINVDIGY